MGYRKLTTLLAAAVVAGSFATVARADQPDPSTWSSTQLEPDGQPQSWRTVDISSSAIGQSVVVYPARDSNSGPPSVHASVKDFAAPLDPPQTLGTGYYPRADASLLGGAVAAWFDGYSQVLVSEMPRGERTFDPPFSLPGAQSGFSYEEPKVAVGDDGTAVVAYLAPDPDGSQHLSAVLRPRDGTFGAPERVSASYGSEEVNATDIAVGPDGTTALGYVADGSPYVAVRPPGGPWQPPERVGDGLVGQAWFMPQVGVDAMGDVAAAWAAPDPDGGEAGPVELAYKPHGAPFRQPRDTGIQMSSLGRIALAVSAVGETILVVEASTNNPYGGTHIEGVQAVYGNLPAQLLLAKPVRLTGIWGDYPQVGWNSRGDVVVTWDECCPMKLQERRRAPLTPFTPAIDIAPPITFEGSRADRLMLDADIDEFGNARASWADGEPNPEQIFVAEDGLGIFDQPPAVPELGDRLIDLLPPDPPPAPAPPPTPAVDPPPVPGVQIPPPPGPARLSLQLGVTIDRQLAGRAHPRVTVRLACNKPCYARLGGKLGHSLLAPTDIFIRRAGVERIGLVLVKAPPRAVTAARNARTVRLSVAAADRDGQVVRLVRRARLAR